MTRAQAPSTLLDPLRLLFLTAAGLTAVESALAFDLERGTEIASITQAQVQGDDHSGTGPGYALSVSADGGSVAFLSVATNLVAGDTNGVRDVFVRDSASQSLDRVSVSTGGAQANGTSYQPTLSGDGRFVAFSTAATNLEALDTNGLDDVYLHDRVGGSTLLVSRTAALTSGNGHSQVPRLSADGRFVCFWSGADDLVPGDTNGTGDIFVYDRINDTLERASVSSSESQSNGPSVAGSISGDGRYVVFSSQATNLVGTDTNGTWDVFVRDRLLGTTERIGPAAPLQWNGAAESPTISDTGRWVAFASAADNVVPGDTNGVADVFVHDRATGTTTRASLAADGSEGDGASGRPALSANGLYVAFESEATNLVPGDTNGWTDVFRYDVGSGAIERASVTDAGLQSNSLSSGPSVSASGRYVAFVSFASNLTPGDANGAPDVFLRDTGPASVGVNYCVGALNSAGLAGKISALGSARVSVNELYLTAEDAPPYKSGIFFYGPNQVQIAFGDGFRCVGGSTQRLQPVLQTDSNGFACRRVDTLAEPVLSDISSVAPIIMNFQFWHRDAMASTNLTDGVEVRFLP